MSMSERDLARQYRGTTCSRCGIRMKGGGRGDRKTAPTCRDCRSADPYFHDRNELAGRRSWHHHPTKETTDA